MQERDKINLADQKLSLRGLIGIEKLQKIQDNFSVVTDVNLRLVDFKGSPLTRPSKEPRLCSELLGTSPAKNRICGLCLPSFLGGEGVVGKNLNFICQPAGLCNLTTPLTLNNNVLGYFIVGPVILVKRESKEEYRHVVEELELDLEDFWSAILEIKVLSFHCAQSILELIKDLVEYILKLSYQNITKEKEMLMSLGSSKLTNFLDALLEVAFEISGADIGSVMWFDKVNSELTIQASRGISKDIVRNTRVKLGSNVSGIAVKEGESFLIDEHTQDNRITQYLERQNLRSSMVIPFKIEDEVAGVINIGTLSTSSVSFTRNNLNLMKRLLDLVSLALHA